MQTTWEWTRKSTNKEFDNDTLTLYSGGGYIAKSRLASSYRKTLCLSPPPNDQNFSKLRRGGGLDNGYKFFLTFFIIFNFYRKSIFFVLWLKLFLKLKNFFVTTK